ncbi:hypothetical protein [Cupriavidus sp. BIC8F]|uniref:hypothetical protein n=1 Tax=Cupriavidus sp. BIC8F TaxID=3079014 RepID=UPI0029163D2C|nr:hypothetical protein [Cupriavidus sp. BIC8F]
MNIALVEEKVKTLAGRINRDEFLFELLECYGKPKASITRLKMVGKGSYNLSKNAEEILWKKQVYFKATKSDKLTNYILIRGRAGTLSSAPCSRSTGSPACTGVPP